MTETNPCGDTRNKNGLSCSREAGHRGKHAATLTTKTGDEIKQWNPRPEPKAPAKPPVSLPHDQSDPRPEEMVVDYPHGDDDPPVITPHPGITVPASEVPADSTRRQASLPGRICVSASSSAKVRSCRTMCGKNAWSS